MDIRKEGETRYKKLKADYGSDLLGLFRDQLVTLPKQRAQVARLVDIDVLSKSWCALRAKDSFEPYVTAPGASETLMEGWGIPCVEKTGSALDYIAQLELLIIRISKSSIPNDLIGNDDSTIDLLMTVDCLCSRWQCFASTDAFKNYQRSLIVYPGS